MRGDGKKLAATKVFGTTGLRGVVASESPVSQLAQGDVVGGRFQLRERLGRGGMGVVHAARNLITGREVAIKWLHPAHAQDDVSIERLLREARAAARVCHPGVVDIHDVGEHDGVPFLIMERLNGHTLAAELVTGAMEEEPLLGVLRSAMEGLSEAHRCGVIHRDLSPANIFLCVGPADRPSTSKVIDLGVAKLLERDADLVTDLSGDSGGMGTPHYMAPEQFDEDMDVDHRVDIYAMGAVLYRAIGGRVPFPARSRSTMALRASHSSPCPLRNLAPHASDQLVEAVELAMAKAKEDRFSTMEEFIRFLERPRRARRRGTAGSAARELPLGLGWHVQGAPAEAQESVDREPDCAGVEACQS